MMKKRRFYVILIGVVLALAASAYADGGKVSVRKKGGISHKGGGQTAIAVPDVCKSPAVPVPGPVPVPYPNIGSAADTQKGSKRVPIDGKEIGIKKESDYKPSTGDEAPTDDTIQNVSPHKKKPELQRRSPTRTPETVETGDSH